MFVLSSCGEDEADRDDSYDRQQVQNCLNANGKPIYGTSTSYSGKTIIDFIACDMP